MKTHTKYFLVFAWVFMIATHSKTSGIILMAAGLYAIIDIICEWRKENAKGRTE